MGIKVSICIPTYKQVTFLKKCIESILIQDYKDYELIITDDTPDDSVLQLVKTLLKDKPHFYIKNSPSLGSPANWSKAISLATGDYIKIMHHDDCFYDAHSLAEFVKAFELYPETVFAFCNSEVINELEATSRINIPSKKQLESLKTNPINLFLGNFIGAPSATMYRKDRLTVFDNQLKWLVDIDFYMSLLYKNNKHIYINKTLVKTIDGAEHQVTSQCINNPHVELKENCIVFDKLDIPKKLEPKFIEYFSELFVRFDINTINELNKYVPLTLKNNIYNRVFTNIDSYKSKKNKKRFIKSMIKNTLTIALYNVYKTLKANKKIKQQLNLFHSSENATKKRFLLKKEDELFCTDDNTINTGFDRHYVYHLAWAARIVKEINPKEHSDISSLLFFPTILSAFVKVKFYDFRPAQLNLDNLESLKCDLTQLHFKDNSIDSLSCMHTIEHIGLGRYGDPIDYDGDLKAIKELKRVVSIGGNLLFVVPIGKPRIQYNAHRIYGYDQIINYFEGFTLKEFSLIPDSQQQGGLIRNATKEQSDMQQYGCGCFWFIKK